MYYKGTEGKKMTVLYYFLGYNTLYIFNGYNKNKEKVKQNKSFFFLVGVKNINVSDFRINFSK